jgi:hypothetical protein
MGRYISPEWASALERVAQLLIERGYIKEHDVESATNAVYEAMFDALAERGDGIGLVFVNHLRDLLEEEYERGYENGRAQSRP